MTKSEKIRLVIVDDHKVVRNGLKIFLSLFEDIEVVGEAQNGQQALEQCLQHEPDVVLMDLVMPVMDGPTAIQHIREQLPSIEFIALTSFEEDALVHRAITNGAISFLYKDVEEEELVNAIRAANKGHSIVAPEALQSLVKHITRQSEIPKAQLTTREEEILTLIAKGMTNPQIAEQLIISTSTVHFHVHNILDKLQVRTRAEAVSVALQNHLLNTNT
jgi:NarL family two-component system response regulator LiaR